VARGTTPVPSCRATLALAALLALSACEAEPPPPPRVTLTPVALEALPGWQADAVAEVLPAWRRSCARLTRLPPERELGADGIGGNAGDWRGWCEVLAAIGEGDAALRHAMRDYLAAYLVTDAANDSDGLFTGYFEPELRGARTRDATYRVPIYGVPDDLVRVDLGTFDGELEGRHIVGRIAGGRLEPYPDRGAVDAGALDGNARPLVWVDDPLDAFVLHVQGSGKVLLPDGTMRVGYAAHNGHDYGSVGRWLIDSGELEAHQASWAGIRAWMEANPARVAELMAVNPRYIFFHEIDGDGPIGAAGLVLTPGRSLAVDRRYLALDVPLWLDAEDPRSDRERLQRLMLAQDTGAAIKGVVRGDFYWGSGAAALRDAGRMKSRGRYYLLLPKTLQPTALAAN